MVHYDHAMLGATLAVAAGALRRVGWLAVIFAALAGTAPDWDATPKHLSPRAYQLGHRVWGHNLFVATLAGVALGLLGHLIHRSRSNPPSPPASPPAGVGYWIALCVLILWSHPLMDLLYCGLDRDADWPVRLFWPLTREGYAAPWVPWSDWGATAILAAGLVAVAAAGRFRQGAACASLLALALYVAARGLTHATG